MNLMPAKAKRHDDREYFFIDIDLNNRQIIGWGTETKPNVEVHLSGGYHRVFLSRGQYNKLVKQLDE